MTYSEQIHNALPNAKQICSCSGTTLRCEPGQSGPEQQPRNCWSLWRLDITAGDCHRLTTPVRGKTSK